MPFQPVLIQPHVQRRLGRPSGRSGRAGCAGAPDRPRRRRRCAGWAGRHGRASPRTSHARCCREWRWRRCRPRFSPSMPRSSQGSGSSPPARLPFVRSGTRGSDQSTAGMWSCSRAAGVSSVRRSMNWALASGPMPPSTPRTRPLGAWSSVISSSVPLPWSAGWAAMAPVNKRLNDGNRADAGDRTSRGARAVCGEHAGRVSPHPRAGRGRDRDRRGDDRRRRGGGEP